MSIVVCEDASDEGGFRVLCELGSGRWGGSSLGQVALVFFLRKLGVLAVSVVGEEEFE